MTRRQQFLKSKAKHKRRANRIWKNHSKVPPNAANNSHRGGNGLVLPVLGRIQCRLTTSKTYNGFLTPSIPDMLPVVFDGTGKGNPPHVKYTFPPYIVRKSNGIHTRDAIAGFHQRGVIRYGRKEGRMNGPARKVWGAAIFCLKNNFYPDWDPLGRHPTAADIDNGAEPVDIDWRWGVTGNYPA